MTTRATKNSASLVEENRKNGNMKNNKDSKEVAPAVISTAKKLTTRNKERHNNTATDCHDRDKWQR